VPRDVVALVSADDAVAAIRVHADRVHDLLRRSGCGPDESVEVTESFALALLDAIVNAPETVGDMAGWWFGRALELVRRLGGTASEATDEASTSVLAGTAGEAQVRAALAELPENERAAVVLRDAYDLPPQAVAVALRREPDVAAGLVAAGRRGLVSRYDDRHPVDLAGHTARTPVDLATLGQLADGTLPPPRTVPLRRHVTGCPACEDAVEALAKGRRLAAGLPVIAMPDDAREAMLERVSERANAVLPTVDDVLLAIEQDDETRPAVSPLAVVLFVVLALILGVAVAAITRSSSGGPSAAGRQPAPTVGPLQPSFSVSPTASASTAATAGRTTGRSASPSTTGAASATASQSTIGSGAVISIAPTQGPRNTTINVRASGWVPNDVVTIVYSGPISSSRQSVTADSRGRFTVSITANGLVPGDYTVQATGSNATASATFRQTS
jgi:DNA-directed RNA polymerase specialized sigma24 family protein